MPRNKSFRVALASIALGVVFSHAHALDIVINPGGTLAGNVAALASFNRAAARWEMMYNDPITVQISANLAPMGPSILGSASSVLLSSSYNTIRNAMVTDASNEASNGIVSFLPTAAQFTVQVPTGFGLDGNMHASKANLKALGFDPTTLDTVAGTTNDATITFNSNFNFQFNDAPPGGTQVDFETVAIHELGHAMGFFSATDDVDFILPSTAQNIQPTPMDLFIFSNANVPTTNAQFTSNARSLVPGAAKRFSDTVNQWQMATGVDFGDGDQASHWKNDDLGGPTIGIMDPSLAFGVEMNPFFSDARALDLIGWELQVVPEPASLVALGLGAAALLRGRRRAKK